MSAVFNELIEFVFKLFVFPTYNVGVFRLFVELPTGFIKLLLVLVDVELELNLFFQKSVALFL